MATLIKSYEFVSDVEDWVATTSEATIDTGWYPPHRSDGHSGLNPDYSGADIRTGPLQTLIGGCLKMTAKQNTAQSANFWELTKTWEELGVPVGATVTNVQGDYLYKWDMGIGGAGSQPKYQNHAEFGGGDTQFGDFELRDSSGTTIIDTFSTYLNGLDRGPGYGGTYYKFFPTATAEYPLSYIPNGWGYQIGINISVPVPYQSSNTQVKFRLNNISPTTAAWGGPGTEPMWVRMKNDHIVFIITYTAPVGGAKYASLKRQNRLTYTNSTNNIILK